MQRREFGLTIRRLREQAKLSQRELALRVGVDVSYLSKIENGVLPPPSQEVILKLARALDADIDELLTLAGKVPADLAQILKNRHVLQFLREGTTTRKPAPGNAENSPGEFHEKLRELREQAGLTLAELAKMVGVSFTYLSKIENGVKPPPSERIILKLAEVLKCDKDDLMASAGKVPSDIAHILKNREIRQSLRDNHARRATMSGTGNGRGMNIMKHILAGRQLARTALALLLVAAIGASLWFAAPQPVRALQVSFPSLPSSGTLGGSYTFQVQVSVETQDLLPVNSIDLEISNTASPSTYKATVADLPIPGTGLTSGSKSYTSAQTGGGAVAVSASTAYGWTWALGSGGRSGYGYRDPDGLGYHTIASSFGYGYGYNLNQGNTSITFTVTWTPPSSWPVGSYNIKTLVYADSAKSKKWSGTSSSFSLSAPVSAAVASPITTTVVTSGLSAAVPLQVNQSGIVQANALLVTSDQKASFNIPQGTRMLDAQGNSLSAITAATVLSPPPPPSGSAVVLAYDFGPDGATFSPPITLSMTYDPASLPSGTVESSLTIAWWNGTNWVTLSTTVNTATKTLTAQVSHFSKFAVMRVLPAPVTPPPPVVTPPAPTPAAFTTSGLAISPTTVNIGGQVTISVRVANTGESSGSYKVTLKINNVAVETKDVTLSGGASQTVTFTTSRDAAGSYTVTIDALSGTFTVSAPAPTPPPPPPPPAEPIKPAPEKGVAAWVWIVIALAVVVIAVGVIWLVRRRMA